MAGVHLATHLLNKLRIDPEGKHAAALLAKAGLLNAKTLPWVSGLTFAYAALFLTEGIGLSLQKRWAEWLTIVSTGSLIPFEAYELATHSSLAKLVLLAANLAIVVFLIWRIRRPTQLRSRQPGNSGMKSAGETISTLAFISVFIFGKDSKIIPVLRPPTGRHRSSIRATRTAVPSPLP